MFFKTELFNSLKSVFFLISLLIALFVWFVDPLIDAVLLNEGNLREQLLQPSSSEVYFRSLVSSLIILFGLTGSFLLNRSRQSEKALRIREEDLKNSESKLKEAQRVARIGSWELDLISDTLYWSDEVFRIFDIDPNKFGADNEAFLNAIHPEDRALVDQTYQDAVKNKTSYSIGHRLLLKDGTEKFVHEQAETFYDNEGKPVRSIGTVQDITERKLAAEEKAILEKALHHSQRLETIGTLTGGIAHDFNNILTPILGYSETVKDMVPPSSPMYSMLESISNGAMRATHLVEQILLFSKQTKSPQQPLHLHSVLQEAVKLVRASIPSTIDIRLRIDDTCKQVLADASQMHQIILNLCTNASHAMEENGGTLTVELQEVQVDEATARSHSNLNMGEYVRLTVMDTGCGMENVTLDRIFEPFFTTKDINKGTGMGLSVVNGIVIGHNGAVLVSSEPGKGTTFHVYLPAFNADEPAPAPEMPDTIRRGRETILIVDDEEAIVVMMKAVLEQLGYIVDAQACSLNALKLFQKRADKYDLVISDLTMPDMTGTDLSQQIRGIRSEIPIIIMTGFDCDLNDEKQKQCGIRKVLHKPIRPHELAAVIREVLDKESCS